MTMHLIAKSIFVNKEIIWASDLEAGGRPMTIPASKQPSRAFTTKNWLLKKSKTAFPRFEGLDLQCICTM
jgi:hypothetical protein